MRRDRHPFSRGIRVLEIVKLIDKQIAYRSPDGRTDRQEMLRWSILGRGQDEGGPPSLLKGHPFSRGIRVLEIVKPIDKQIAYRSPDGGTGRRAGLKIQWPEMAVPVRSRLRVPLHSLKWIAFYRYRKVYPTAPLTLAAPGSLIKETPINPPALK